MGNRKRNKTIPMGDYDENYSNIYDDDAKIAKCDDQPTFFLDENVDLSRKKAFLEFRCVVEDAILGNHLLGNSHRGNPNEGKGVQDLRDITLWDVPLLPSEGDEGTDIVLLKFLKAKDYNVHESFKMLRKTMKWRRQYGIDGSRDEKFDETSLGNTSYIGSMDRGGHPVLYHKYDGVFKDKDSYNKMFGTKERRDEFVKSMAKLMENGIQKLSFEAGGVQSMIEVTDLKNIDKAKKKELRVIFNHTFMMLQDHYPELIHKHIMINVPFWYYTFHSLLLSFANGSSKDKFIFARPSKVTKTLLKFIAPEELPVHYGGLKRENDTEFSPEDKVLEVFVKKGSVGKIRIPITEAGATVAWDLTVVGWDVMYKEEFVPEDDCSYKVLLQKPNRCGESIRNSFYVNEPGAIVITIDNKTRKKKRVLYRTKSKPTLPMYIFLKK